MITAHAKMEISEVSFHALAYHLLAELEKHGAGGKEREKNVSRFCTHSNLPFKLVQGAPCAAISIRPYRASSQHCERRPARYLKGSLFGRLYFTGDLSLDDWYSLCLSSSSCLPLLLAQLFRKVGQVSLDTNNSGLFQFNAGPFYSGDGIVSALPFFRSSPCGADSTWHSLGRLLDFHHTCCWLRPCANRRFGAGRRFHNATEEEEAKLKKNVYFQWSHGCTCCADGNSVDPFTIKEQDLSSF